MVKKVFISYATVDGKPFADKVYETLNSDVYDIWLDYKKIDKGQDFYSEINKGLRAADVLLVIMTPGAVLSPQVTGEWNDALNRYIPIIVLYCRDSDLPPVLATLQYIDLRRNAETELNNLLLRLRTLDDNHRNYLEDTLRAFHKAQADAEDPERFQPKIDALVRAIDRLNAQSVSLDVDALTPQIDVQPISVKVPIGGQFPFELTHLFVGRSAEREQMKALLADADIHLVSIIGRANVGKTALTAFVLKEIAQGNWSPLTKHPIVTGILYLSASNQDLGLEYIFAGLQKLIGGKVAQEIATVWQDKDIRMRIKVTDLLERLTDRHIVIVLDKLDTLIDATGVITDEDLRTFIEVCITYPNPSGVQLLVTSRLAVPLSAQLVNLNHRIPMDISDGMLGLSTTEGIQLLRALDPEGQFGLADADEVVLESMVSLVHGIPKALETLVMLIEDDPFSDVQQILGRFMQNPHVLNTLVEEQFQRLNAEARQIIQAIAVFGRPVTLKALQFLFTPFAPSLDVSGILSGLIKLKTVKFNRESQTVWLLDIDQQYAYATLSDDNPLFNRRGLHRRAASWYAEQYASQISQTKSYEFENVFAQFDQLVRAQAYDDAARLLDIIDEEYPLQQGFEGRLRAMRWEIAGHLSDPFLVANNLGALGRVYRYLGDLEQAASLLQQAVATFRRLEKREGLAEWLAELGVVTHKRGQSSDAILFHQEAIVLAREFSQERTLTFALNELALCFMIALRFDEAKSALNEALIVARRINSRHSEASVLADLGFLHHRYLDQDGAAQGYYDQAYLIARSLKIHASISIYLMHLGTIRVRAGDLDGGIELYREASEQGQLSGANIASATRLYRLATVYRLKGNMADAYLTIEQAFNRAQQTTSISSKIDVAEVQIQLMLNQNQFVDAFTKLSAMVQIAHDIKRPRDVQRFSTLLAQVALHQQRLTDALDLIKHVECVSVTYTYVTYTIHGIILARLGRGGEARVKLIAGIEAADDVLKLTESLFAFKYIRALCYAALAMLSPLSEQDAALKTAKQAYQEALANCDAIGVRADARLLLREVSMINELLLQEITEMLS